MSPIQRLSNVLVWAIVLFIALGLYSKSERILTVYIGCRLSSSFAQTIADQEEAARKQREKNPQEVTRVGAEMQAAKYALRGTMACVLSIFVVYYRWNSQRSATLRNKGPLEWK